MKKLFVLALILVVALFVFSEKVVVEFWHAMGGGHGEALKQLAEVFNKENPDVEVKLVYVGNYGALSRKLLTTVTAYTQGQRENLPVMAQAYANWTAKFLFSNVVEPLNSYIENDPQFKEVWDKEIYDVFKEMCTWGDKIYSVPFNKSVYTLFYNVDLFDLYGIEPPKTLDDLMNMAEELTEDVDGDGEIDTYGFGYRTTVDTFQIFLYAFGGKVLEYVGNGKYKIVLDEAIAKKTMKFLKDMKEKDLAFVQGGYMSGPFGDGKVAAYIGSIAGKPYVERASKGKHDWTWTFVPSKDGTPRPPIAGTDLIIFSWASPAQKKAAWRFIKFLLSPENQAFWAFKTGYVPVRKDVVNTTQWKVYVATDEKPTIALKSLETAIADPKPAAWYEIRNELGRAFSNYIYGKISLDEAYNSMIESLKKLLSENDELAE